MKDCTKDHCVDCPAEKADPGPCYCDCHLTTEELHRLELQKLDAELAQEWADLTRGLK